MTDFFNQRTADNEIIYELSDEDSDHSFFKVKDYISEKFKLTIAVRMGGVMDEFYSEFIWEDIAMKLEYCHWTGTEIKVSNTINKFEKQKVERLVLELTQELKKDSS